MRFLARSILTVLLLAFLACPLLAQNKPVLCADTCEPDPTSGSYSATYATRPQSKNARAGGSIISGNPGNPGNPGTDGTFP
jgi:hypothetical protein